MVIVVVAVVLCVDVALAEMDVVAVELCDVVAVDDGVEEAENEPVVDRDDVAVELAVADCEVVAVDEAVEVRVDEIVVD